MTDAIRGEAVQHAELPWRVHDYRSDPSNDPWMGAIDATGRGPMFELKHLSMTQEEYEARAALIVRAVNAHDALLEACKAVVALAEPQREHFDTDDERVFLMVRDAIAKAFHA